MKNTLKIVTAVLALVVGSASYVASAEAMKGHHGKCMSHSSHGKCQMKHGHKKY